MKGSLDSLFKAKVTGSKTQDESDVLAKSSKSLSDSYSQLVTQYQIASQSGDAASLSAIEKQLDSIQVQMTALQKDFIKNNPKSYVSPSILIGLSYEMEPDEIESLVNGLDTSLVALASDCKP